MKRLFIAVLSMVLCAGLLTSCERKTGVRAGNDEQDYQPRPGPPVNPETGNKELRGELRRVDTLRKTIVMRVDSGMDQTFSYDDATAVTGVNIDPKTSAPLTLKSLVNNYGSEIVVQWKDFGAEKIATQVNVTDLKVRRRRR